jgi:hypothetical protein
MPDRKGSDDLTDELEEVGLVYRLRRPWWTRRAGLRLLIEGTPGTGRKVFLDVPTRLGLPVLAEGLTH